MIIETTPISSEKESLYILMYEDYFITATNNSDFSLTINFDYEFDIEDAEFELKHAQQLYDMIVNKKHWRTKEDIEVYLDISEDILEYTDIEESFAKYLRIVNIQIDTYVTRTELN